MLMRYLTTKLDAIHRLVMSIKITLETIMLNLQGLTAANATLVEKITDLETVTSGVVALQKQSAQQLRDLAAQIEALKASAGNPETQQAEIDTLAQATRDLATDVETKAKAAAAALVEHTNEPVPEPVPAAPNAG
jgi:TolA-binding protein